MRYLFLRIFLWFWLTMATVAVILVVSSPFFTRSRSGLERWQRSAESILKGGTERVAELLANEGIEGLRLDLRRSRRDRHVSLFVYDARGEQAYGREPSPEARSLALRVLAGEGLELQRSGTLHLAAQSVVDPQGERYAVVVAVRRPPSAVDLLEPEWLIPRLLALTLIAGVLCFWLARTLTSPVAALRQTVRQLADGDLSARVGAPIGRRRDEIGDLARDFDAMAERIVTLLGAQRRLVRDISHELRSPLARVRVALELARTGSGERARRALDRIDEESERLNSMIEQVLTLSRLETGGREIERTSFDLSALLEEVVDDASFEASPRGCNVDLASELAVEVQGSPSLLRSAVENVLRNAVRYSADGSEIEVVLSTSGSAGERRAVIAIRDHGPGVPEDRLDRLFQPFFRVDEARDRDSGGTGLGLAIAARAIELHDGTIAAHNAPGGGLEVTLSFPVA